MQFKTQREAVDYLAKEGYVQQSRGFWTKTYSLPGRRVTRVARVDTIGDLTYVNFSTRNSTS